MKKLCRFWLFVVLLTGWWSIQMIQEWISEGAPSWLKMVAAKDLGAAGMPWPQEHLNHKSLITLGGRMGEAMYLHCAGSPADRSRKIDLCASAVGHSGEPLLARI